MSPYLHISRGGIRPIKGRHLDTRHRIYMSKKKTPVRGQTKDKKTKHKVSSRKTATTTSTRSTRRGITNLEIEEAIRRLFEQEPNKVFNYKQVCYLFGQTSMAQKRQIVSVLESLVMFGLLEEVEMGRYRLAALGQTLEGQFTCRSGRYYFEPDNGSEPIPLSERAAGRALHGDRVRIKISTPKGRRRESEVIIDEILERSEQTYVGNLQVSRGHAFFVSESRELRQDIYIPIDQMNGAHKGDKVIVRILGWDKRAKNPHGTVIDVLGKAGDNNAEMHAILAEFGLPYSYPEEVERAADELTDEITPEELARREDFRSVTTFTIDPRDAKDFDDALSIRHLDNGLVEVGVHIADVSYFVRPGSKIDEEAYKRATSIYLVDRTIPMLPERLCNLLCSLRPDEDKYSYSCVFTMNAEAEIIDSRITRGVIRSNRRFTYEEAQEMIQGAEGDFKAEVLELNTLAQKLRARRFEHGSIAFDRPEVRFEIDEMGRPVSVYIKESLEAHQLIEEFMLLANKTVALAIGRPESGNAKTFVYRVHDQPDQEKMTQLAEVAGRLGYRLRAQGSNRAISDSLNKLLADAKGKPENNLLSTIAIRTMAKAKYTTENIGHYGLSFDFYTHFTSPIRRYPDLMVHRLLTRYLVEGGKSADKKTTEEACEHSSAMEQLAAQAERSSIRYKQVEYMSRFLGEEFDGVISGVTEWGLYVELDENKCEGMIPTRDLTDDYYELDEDSFTLIGRHTKRRFTLGDKVRIQVAQANLERKQLDFALVEE